MEMRRFKKLNPIVGSLAHKLICAREVSKLSGLCLKKQTKTEQFDIIFTFFKKNVSVKRE